MLNIMLNRSSLNYIKRRFKKYQIGDLGLKYVKYQFNLKDHFNIKVYTTNTCIITGVYSEKIYEHILKNCNEVNFCGYDEVGVGDFFGPTVYTSVLLDEKSIDFISKSNLEIKDSKKIDNLQVLKMYETLKDNVNYKTKIVYDKDFQNLNSIEQKCTFHNCNINDKATTHIIDLFTTENSFFKYAKTLNLIWPENLILETKADSKFYCVAIASIISRALFLLEIKKLNIKYNTTFPLGSTNVVNCAKNFVKDYSKEELATFCKTTFKTFNQI